MNYFCFIVHRNLNKKICNLSIICLCPPTKLQITWLSDNNTRMVKVWEQCPIHPCESCSYGEYNKKPPRASSHFWARTVHHVHQSPSPAEPDESRASETSDGRPSWLPVHPPHTWMGSNNVIIQTFQMLLDQMDQILVIERVTLRGLWRSEHFIHSFTATFFSIDCVWEKCFLGQCASHDECRSCNILCSHHAKIASLAPYTDFVALQYRHLTSSR